MILKILGTQSPYAKGNHNCPAFLITDGDYKILLDCGSGTHKMLNLPQDLHNLSVVISHLHRDHYNDIYNLQYSAYVFHNHNILEQPFDMYLPKTPLDKNKDIVQEEYSFANYHTIDENSILKIGNLQITFCKTDHPVETYAIKIECNNKKIVYTADTSFSAKDKLAEFAQNADLIISEASLLTSYGFPEINSHLTAKQAGLLAKQARAKKLMLTHLWPEEMPQNYLDEAKAIFENVVIANENDTEEF